MLKVTTLFAPTHRLSDIFQRQEKKPAEAGRSSIALFGAVPLHPNYNASFTEENNDEY
jgi:hypothetical protein